MPQCELFLYTNCETFYFVFVRTVGGSSASSGANSMSILAAELDRIFVPSAGGGGGILKINRNVYKKTQIRILAT